ncbi:MAG: hypothetical protein ACLGI8_14500 [Acidimicrobiia bacterium]|jgi:hypothetical protein
MAHTTSTDRALTDLRIILWLGLLVAAWLLLTPTSTADGRSCGTPAFHLSHPGPDRPQLADETCVDRNNTRLDQAVVTVVLTLVATGGAALARSLADARSRGETPRLTALTYRPEQSTPSTRAEAQDADRS